MRPSFVAKSGNRCSWTTLLVGNRLAVDIKWRRKASAKDIEEFNQFAISNVLQPVIPEGKVLAGIASVECDNDHQVAQITDEFMGKGGRN